tara:strand:- start:145 stop:1362 length:1218 start_codon:yes stop_codon:yes gene_type:complete
VIVVKNKALIIVLVLLSAGISGYEVYQRYFTEEEPRFQWPDKLDIPCQPTSDSFDCDFYLQANSTPVKTLLHPLNDEVWVAELDGKISSWDGSLLYEVGNISQIISRCHFEQGLLGFEFTHDFATSNQILLSYTEDADCDGPSNLSGVMVASVEIVEGKIDLNTVVELRRIAKENRNHNGGNLHSLNDGTYLWSIGDGGGSSDPFNNGQNIHSPLGTIQYFSYQNNTISPVLQRFGNDSDYVLHHGLRNPWKFDTDNQGRLWIADVGQYCYEEINLVAIQEASNFGWSEREGMHDYDESDDCTSPPTEPANQNLTDPIIEYPHIGGNCSITGGFWMDWGPESMKESYVYGDFCTGSIWQITATNIGWESNFITSVGTQITGFGQGINDELLIFSWIGAIYHIYEV